MLIFRLYTNMDPLMFPVIFCLLEQLMFIQEITSNISNTLCNKTSGSILKVFRIRSLLLLCLFACLFVSRIEQILLVQSS